MDGYSSKPYLYGTRFPYRSKIDRGALSTLDRHLKFMDKHFSSLQLIACGLKCCLRRQTWKIMFLIRVESFSFYWFSMHCPFSHATVKNKAGNKVANTNRANSSHLWYLASRIPAMVNHKSAIACHNEITTVWYFQNQHCLSAS